jgi:uncharacterized membrane protein YdjX (TVP38/TMEM64 family)
MKCEIHNTIMMMYTSFPVYLICDKLWMLQIVMYRNNKDRITVEGSDSGWGIIMLYVDMPSVPQALHCEWVGMLTRYYCIEFTMIDWLIGITLNY